MSRDVLALVLGTLLGVGAIAFVLYPLFFGGPDRVARRAAPAPAGDSAIRALREIEFDRATGKLSDTDYAELRKTYGARALEEMREAAAPATDADPIEARVRAYRATRRECASCGLRPEADAIYCSSCGTYLERECPACHGPVPETSAGFCSACGEPLGAAARGSA
jgi:hypothetical protein